ncbi:MAG: HEAT repeat domain-containing protein [Methanolinea sp.]|nr:HEAT repeat domain-containing protein [Methanolinea sp.]
MLPAFILRDIGTQQIPALERAGDIPALVNLLSSRDYRVRNEASDALGRLGAPAVDTLAKWALRGKTRERLGVMEALARIRDTRCTPVVMQILASDPENEMRWMAAITLGEMGDPRAIGKLKDTLCDRDKYVRFGAARALEKLGWRPDSPESEARYRIALQEWSTIAGFPVIPTEVLMEYLDDPDPNVRASIITLLGYGKDPRVEKVCEKVLGDPDPLVRWKASLALPRCNVSPLSLSAGSYRRKRRGKNFYVAAFLNFFFLGLGYNYLGKWWGFLLYQFTLNTVVVLSLVFGSILPYILSFSVSSVAVLHTWILTRGLPDI